MSKRRLRPDAAVAIENLIRNTVGGERLDVFAGRVELCLRAKELQCALHPLVIFDARLVAQSGKRGPAIVREAEHAALVDGISL